MEKAKQLTVCLGNKPGTLAGVSEALAGAKINIIALSVVDNADVCLVRLVVNKPEEAVKVLADKGICVDTSHVLMAKLPNKVGALAEVTRKLADKKVNIDYVYGSTGSGRTQTFVVFGTNKGPTAEKVLARY